jgi:predicted RNase H-like HicB family nuclease
MAKLSYTVIVEKADGNFSAYAPDLPGCVAVGDTVEDTLREMKEAIEFHLEEFVHDGRPIPMPSVALHQVDVSLPAA